jgi:hypothetical protein
MFIGPWRQRRRCLTAGQPILSGNIHNKTTTNTNGPAGLLLRKKDHFLRKTKSLRSVAVRQFRAPASCIFVFAIIGSQQREAAATLLLSAITAFPLALFALSLSLSPSSPSLTLFLLFSVRHHHRHKNSSTCQTPVLGSLQTPSLANTSKTPRRPRRRRPGPRPEAVSVPDLSPARPTPLQPPLIFSQAMPTRLPLPSRLVPVSYRLSPTSPPSSPHTLSSHTSTSWKRTRSTDWFQHFSG